MGDSQNLTEQATQNLRGLIDRIEALEAAMKLMIEELDAVQRQGCEICNGDCASAMPPVPLCPMARRRDTLSAARAAQEGKT